MQAITAHGHFKVAIRQDPISGIWSLAVEWNESYRVLAACGEEKSLRSFVGSLPNLQLQTIAQSDDSGLAFRTEKILKDEDDSLFAQTSPDLGYE